VHENDSLVHSDLPLRHRDRERLAAGAIEFRRVEGRLFGESPRPTDARQGVIGDCYLLSAFSALARSDPSALRSLLVDNGDGSYTARFHRRREGGGFAREQVRIDGLVPVLVSDGTPIYARSHARGELWPLLAEKAYAAWKGGYDVIGEGGMVEATLEEVTGQPTRLLLTAQSEPESLWDLLSRATEQGWPAAVCTYGRHERPAIDDLGFHPNHILIFLGVHTWMGRRIVWLRDPFDVPACGALVKPDPHGVYTIGWDEFLGYFAEVELSSSAAVAAMLPPFPSVTIGAALADSFVFAALADGTRAALADAFSRVVVEAGFTITEARQPADHFFVIEHGQAAIEVADESGRAHQVATAHAGEHFGEVHVLDDRCYDASLRALTPMALYRMTADRLRQIVKKHPELERRFRQRFDLKLAMLGWGKHQLSTIDVDTLLRTGQERVVRAQSFVFREGDVVDGVYIVVHGQVELRTTARGRSRRLAELGPGGVFGEIEVLARKQERASSAFAVGRARLVRVDLGAAAERIERFDIVQRQLAALAERRERIARQHNRHSFHIQ
jgi:CRP-like cAMP-binding protein